VASGSGGTFVYSAPEALPPGPHELRASAEAFGIRSPLSEASLFDVVSPIGDWPVVVSPTQGEQVDPTPLIAGTSPSGSSVSIHVDGSEVKRVQLDPEGRFYYTLAAAQALAPGEHSVTVQAWDGEDNSGLMSPPTGFQVMAPTSLGVGCGCGASPGAGLAAVALLLGVCALGWRRRNE
jgi:hypothetical protein